MSLPEMRTTEPDVTVDPLVELLIIGCRAFGFTRRWREIVVAIANGLTTPEIAERLCITTQTLKNHMTEMFRRTQTDRRDQMLLALLRRAMCQGEAGTGPQLRVVPLGLEDDLMVAARQPEELTVDDLARLALARAKGDVQEAVKLLAAWAEDDPLTLRDLTRPVLTDAARRAINRVHRETKPAAIRSIIEKRREAATAPSADGERPALGAPATPPVRPRLVPPAAAPSTAGLTRLATANVQSLLGFELPNGMKLGEAKREHVRAAAVHYARTARQRAQMAQFLDRVSRVVGDEYSRVKDVIDEAGLKAIFEDVKRGDA